MGKQKLDQIMAPMVERFVLPIKRALSDTGLTGKDFYAVEITGGSMRIPAFKIAAAKTVDVFVDDANISYGLKNTMDIVESCMYPIKISWENGEGIEAPVLGLPPMPNLPVMEGVEDISPGESECTGSMDAKGNAVQTIGGDKNGCVLFDRNAKCGEGRAGDRTLSFRRNQK